MTATTTKLAWLPKNLANLMVYARLVLCVPSVLTLTHGLYHHNTTITSVAASILFVQLLLDRYDGRFARSKYGTVSAYGARIDALSDKVMIHPVLLIEILWLRSQVSHPVGNWLLALWLVNLFLDFISVLHYLGTPGAMSIDWGKYKLVAQATAAFWGMVGIIWSMHSSNLTPALVIMFAGLITAIPLASLSLFFKFKPYFRNANKWPDRLMSSCYALLEYLLEPTAVWLSQYRHLWVVRNISNIITCLRLPTSLYLSYLLYGSTSYQETLLLILAQILLLMADGVDGTLARLTDTTSDFGVAADGIADRTMFAGMFSALFLRVNNGNWWTGDTARFVTILFIVLTAAFEIGVGYLNTQEKASNPDFTATKKAKWRFVAHGEAMILPWLMPTPASQAVAMTICLMAAFMASAYLYLSLLLDV